MFLNLRAEAIKGILNIRQSISATPGSSSVIQSVQGLSLSSNGESTPGSSTGEKRPHLTAKELEVLKYECLNWVIYELPMKQWIIAFSTCETKTFFFTLYTSSKNYPYLPHGRDFSLDPAPPPPLRKFQSSFIHLLKFWAFENPPPLGISYPFCGGSMDSSGTTQCKEDHHTKKCNLHTVGSCKTKAWKLPDLDSDLDEFSKLHCNWKLVINWLEQCTSITEVRVRIQANLNFFRLSICNFLSKCIINCDDLLYTFSFFIPWFQ